jgi:hypothetical protein
MNDGTADQPPLGNICSQSAIQSVEYLTDAPQAMPSFDHEFPLKLLEGAPEILRLLFQQVLPQLKDDTEVQ